MSDEIQFTSIDFAKAYGILLDRTGLPHAMTTGFLLQFLQNPRNYRGRGYSVDSCWEISNAKLAAELHRRAASTGSNYKDAWLAFNFVELNDKDYSSSVYMQNGEYFKHGCSNTHQIRITKAFRDFLIAVKNGEEIQDEMLEAFIPGKEYGKRHYRKRRMNNANARTSTQRRYAQENGTEVPPDCLLLTPEERRKRLYKRPDIYIENLKQTRRPTRRQRREIKGWKHKFLIDYNVYGLEEALRRLKRSMKAAGWAREDYIIAVLNMLSKRGTENDQLFAINFVFNKPFIDLVDTLTEEPNKLPAALSNHVDMLQSANIPSMVIPKVFSYWLSKVAYSSQLKASIKGFVNQLIHQGQANQWTEEEPTPQAPTTAPALDFGDLESGIPDP
ncbi:hypothetical protein [Pseudobacteriovorax antillogorgiicola]|uniref:Uncharacterized protein n=1 Tax=Pseudobacteriovorax antillogorgiicola TaxID=1513793 RepID=A0A1Y6CNQ7_9BACT|nr:hypothetical protein [Pseudobacteriovorax antillogorgiicola]TCS44215.1 hypothetical protein EDD56_13415 [Pseudobacteriovorax antillogorgiicola]SMF80463.1 hypothetical protein SAMN06296036_13516 [Pseudobacteriovorax antillogorgiicola]